MSAESKEFRVVGGVLIVNGNAAAVMVDLHGSGG
jgi:hypothetical protein